MEDIVKFLLVAAAIVVGIAKQFKQEPKENRKKQPVPPATGAEEPLPQPWESRQEARDAAMPDPSLKRRKKKAPAPQPFVPQGTRPDTRHPAHRAETPQPPAPEKEEETPDYGIRSAEEARRAVVWAEILRRKYE